MTTYLVAGGCGFIGSNFVHFLLERQSEAKVVVVTNLDTVAQVIGLLGKVPGEWLEHVADRPNHDRRCLINPARIETGLGWKPEVPHNEPR